MGKFCLKEFDYLSRREQKEELLDDDSLNQEDVVQTKRALSYEKEFERQMEILEPERQKTIDHFNNFHKEKKAKEQVRELMTRGKSMEDQEETYKPEILANRLKNDLAKKRGQKKVKRLDTKKKLAKRIELNKTKKRNTKRA